MSKEKDVQVTSKWDDRLQDSVVHVLNKRGQIWVRQGDVQDIIQHFYEKLKGGNSKVLQVPLALKLVGALLQDGVYPQTLKDELQKHPIRTLSPQDYSTREHLSACIGAAYKRLSETLKHALAVYSHLPGTFDIKAAGGVLNISSSNAEINVVNRLRNRCLIEYDGRSRLEIHRLIAAYVKEADTKFVTSKLFLLNFELNYA